MVIIVFCVWSNNEGHVCSVFSEEETTGDTGELEEDDW
jgi:hypothetical protein